MTAIQILLDIVAAVLIAVTLWDMFITVFSASGAGPMTLSWTTRVWKVLLSVHKRRPIHRLISLAGPMMLLVTIVIWYVLLGVGLFLTVAAHPDSVINNMTGEQVGLAKKIYFVSTTISSLGYGDLVPSGLPWTMVCTAGTLAATIVLTVSLSYVLSVLMASIEHRKLAQGIFGLGSSIPEIVLRAQLSGGTDSLKNHVLSLATEIDGHAFKHLAYPILKFFHTTRAESSPSRAILLLSDTFFVLGTVPKEHRPPLGVQHVVESSIGNYAELTNTSLFTISIREQDTRHLLEAAARFGVPVEEDADFRRSLEDYLPRRIRLLELCHEDGWYES